MKPLLKSDNARRLQAAMSNAPIGAALVSPTGYFLSANQALLDILGAPNEQALLDQPIRESGSYKNKKVRNLIDRLDRNEPEANFDAAWESAWGKHVNARVFATQLFDADGDPVYQVFYENLLDHENESDTKTWSSMLDASTNEFYVIHETTLKHIYVSKRAIQQTGYSMAELMDMTPAQLCGVMTLQEVKENVLAPLETESSYAFDSHIQRKDGSRYDTKAVIQKTTFKGDAAYLVIVQDVTKAMATDAALRQARLFLNSAPDPTIIINNKCMIVFASERTEALFGFSQGDLIGMNMGSIWPTIDELGTDIGYSQPILPSICLPNEGTVQDLRHRDGSVIPVETSFCQIQTSEEILVAIACRDVTKRQATERALKKAKEQAEHATQTKSHLLAAASHDLRQPTQSLSQYCWLLQQEATTPAVNELARSIQSSVDSIADLLNTLLDISKLENGVIKPQVSHFDISSQQAGILSNYGPAARAKGIGLTCSGKRFFVRSDPALLGRILSNLVANAIRYTHSGNVAVSWTAEKDDLIVTVSDTGIGIDNEQVEKIFDEHYQIQSAQSSESKGLGLGLSIVQRVSTLLRHPVTVKSALGQGSQFSIKMPLANPVAGPEAVALDAGQAIPAAISRQVLLIDDELAVLKSTKMVLERNQCTVHSADSGENAIKQLQDGFRPDILVTDYRLPGLSGIDLVVRARETLGADIPAVIVTGDMSGAAISIDHLSPIQLLHKPTSIRTLMHTIEKMTE